MDIWLERLAEAMTTPVWGYVAAWLAGLLTSLSPCALAVIPLAIGYVGGYAGGKRGKTFLSALAFVGGLTFAFTVLGYVAGTVGYVWLALPWIRGLLGVVVAMLGLNVLGVWRWQPPVLAPAPGNHRGLWGGFVLGAAVGTVSSPCATPALIAILALSATTASPAQATALMAAYAMGHWVTIFVAALAAGQLPAMLERRGLRAKAQVMIKAMGLLLLVAGVWMLTDVLIALR